MKFVRALGALAAWIQIAIYGLMLAAFAGGIGWVMWRQSPAATIFIVTVGAILGAIAWFG